MHALLRSGSRSGAQQQPQPQSSSDDVVEVGGSEPVDLGLDPCHETLGAIDLLLDRPISQRDRNRWPSLIFKHHLYNILTDRCQVDHEVDQLQSRNVIRVIRVDRIPPSPLLVIIRTDELAELLLDQFPNSAEIESFVDRVFPAAPTTEISRDELSLYCEETDCSISVLLDLGLVVNLDETMLRFSIPECGRLVYNLVQGRLEMISIIKRRKQARNRLLHVLCNEELNKSTLTAEFVVHDLLALGVIERDWRAVPPGHSLDPVITISTDTVL